MAPRPAAAPIASGLRDFSRTTRVAYAYADVTWTVVWLGAIVAWAPAAGLVLLAGLIAGVVAICVDYLWFYRSGRRELRVAGQPASPRFVLAWLVGYFDFLIAFNLGTYAGWMLLVGLGSDAGLAVTAGFWAWFCVATPTLARLLEDLGVGRELVTTVRRFGARGTWMRLVVALAANAALCLTVLDGDVVASAGLFVIGMLTAGAMETPIYALGIRPGRQAWKAWLLNTICEWNYAVPILYVIFAGLGAFE